MIDVDEGFEAFWEEYPRRQSKGNALRAWTTLQPSLEVQQAIHAALRWQKREWPNPKLIPLPANYLRGEHWLDEPRAKPAQESRLPVWERLALKEQEPKA